MLGSVKQTWNWIGSGKHPTAGDYFKVGQFTPILEAVAGWLENGFQRFVATGNEAPDSPYSHNSWRFWIRAPKTDHMVVGVVKDSSDSLGRPYPLLIAGTGHLKNCEANWDLMPFSCEKVWGQMEYLGTAQYDGIDQVADRVNHIYPPDQDWPKMSDQRESTGRQAIYEKSHQVSMDTQKVEGHIEAMVHMPEIIVPMNMGREEDPLIVAGLLHRMLKEKLAAFPNAIFMGGVPERTLLAVFQRPLSTPDFILLWSAYKNNGPGYRSEAQG